LIDSYSIDLTFVCVCVSLFPYSQQALLSINIYILATRKLQCRYNVIRIISVHSHTRYLFLSVLKAIQFSSQIYVFQGVTPNLCRTGVLVGTTFSVYDESKHFVIGYCNMPDGLLSYTM